MRPLWLSAGLFTVPLLLSEPVQGAVIPSCCVMAPGEPNEPDPRIPSHLLVPAEVGPRREPALEAFAEAPVPTEVPPVNAIGVPLDAPRGVSVPDGVQATNAAPLSGYPYRRTDFDVMSPCCSLAAGEIRSPEPPEKKEKHPVVLEVVDVPVKNRTEHALEAAVELRVPKEAPLVNAVGFPLEERRGVSEPAFRPAPVVQRIKVNAAPWPRAIQANADVSAVLLIIFLTIGTWLLRRRPGRRFVEGGRPIVSPLLDEIPVLDAPPRRATVGTAALSPASLRTLEDASRRAALTSGGSSQVMRRLCSCAHPVRRSPIFEASRG